MSERPSVLLTPLAQPAIPHRPEGSIVYVRYYDHVLFRDADSSLYKPFIREAIGWLDYEDDTCIRLVWERYAEPVINEESRIRATGLAIRKSDIIEMRKIV